MERLAAVLSTATARTDHRRAARRLSPSRGTDPMRHGGAHLTIVHGTGRAKVSFGVAPQ